MYNAVPTVIDDSNITHMSVIPHGVTVVAQGNYTSAVGGGLKQQLISEQEIALEAGGPMGDVVEDSTPIGSTTGCAPMMFGRVQGIDWGDPELNGTEAEWHANASNRSRTRMTAFLTQRTEQLSDVLQYNHISVFQEGIAQTPF